MRLEQDLDLVAVERAAEVDFELVSQRIVAGGAFVERQHRPRLARLRFGERAARPAEEGGGIVVGSCSDDAGTARQGDDMVAADERPPGGLDQLTR